MLKLLMPMPPLTVALKLALKTLRAQASAMELKKATSWKNQPTL